MRILRARWRVGVILLAAILGWVGPAQAQTEPLHTIGFGRHVLAVGMEKTVVLAMLEGDFTLTELTAGFATDPQWGILSKTGPPFRVLGSILFKNGKLARASRRWDQDTESALALAQAIYRLATSLVNEGVSTCRITTEQSLGAELERRDVSLDCGEKSMGITVSISPRPDFADQAMVSEILGPARLR